MNKIRIAHLYYDLMNLYGENGNIMALVKGFEDQDMFVEVINLSVGDKIDFNKYDLYYIGCGSEFNQRIVIEDLIKYKEKVKVAIEDGKHIILTGNSYELLGNYIEKVDGEKLETLGLFDFYSKEISFIIFSFMSSVKFSPKARRKAFLLTAALKQSTDLQIYAPLPFFLPVRSREISPSGERTTRTSSALGFISPQPQHCLNGIFFCFILLPSNC